MSYSSGLMSRIVSSFQATSVTGPSSWLATITESPTSRADRSTASFGSVSLIELPSVPSFRVPCSFGVSSPDMRSPSHHADVKVGQRGEQA